MLHQRTNQLFAPLGLPQCRLERISALTLMQCNDAIGLSTMLVTRHMPVGSVQLVAAV